MHMMQKLFKKKNPKTKPLRMSGVQKRFFVSYYKHILFQADQCVTKLEIQNKIIVYKNLNYQYPVYFGYE